MKMILRLRFALLNAVPICCGFVSVREQNVMLKVFKGANVRKEGKKIRLNSMNSNAYSARFLRMRFFALSLSLSLSTHLSTFYYMKIPFKLLFSIIFALAFVHQYEQHQRQRSCFGWSAKIKNEINSFNSNSTFGHFFLSFGVIDWLGNCNA